MAPRGVTSMFSLGCVRGFCIGTLDFCPGKLHPQFPFFFISLKKKRTSVKILGVTMLGRMVGQIT